MDTNEEKKLREEVLKIYTPLSVAKKEIWKRWNDKELRKKVEDFLKNDIPECMKDGPKAMLVRHIASPNYELLYYIDLVNKSGVDYRCVEFVEDKFIAKNLDKYHLAKMYFFYGFGKHAGEKIRNRKVIDIQDCEGERICDIKTVNNEDFVKFHHDLLFLSIPQVEDKIYDISPWFYRKGSTAKEYYLYYLSLFVCHGILFENFSLKDDKTIKEGKFCNEIAIPAINDVKKIFGIKPLIVPLIPIETEPAEHWWHYSSEIESIINTKIPKK